MADAKRKLPKLKTQLSWKAEYLFLQFSSKENLMFCKTCSKFEDEIKSSKNYNPSFVEGCSNFWKSAIVEHAKTEMHNEAYEFEDMQEAQKLVKKYKKKKKNDPKKIHPLEKVYRTWTSYLKIGKRA